jgi:hypothetical protein
MFLGLGLSSFTGSEYEEQSYAPNIAF